MQRSDLGEASTRIPHYYMVGGIVSIFDVADEVWPAQHNYNLKDALKYLVRHGRKDGASPVKDLTKCLRCVAREIRRLGGEVPDDL